ncbi:MAG TPA: acylphosphatase [Candidatus Paceibacterota bacterium]|nr:acylphosphatase [Candidatus Paceibacterota bacterium]
MIKYIESGISGKGLGFHYLQSIKNLALSCQIKGIVFTRPDGSIRVLAKGEEGDLMEFANKLERESNSREIENFYTKWGEPNKDLEIFYIVAR